MYAFVDTALYNVSKIETTFAVLKCHFSSSCPNNAIHVVLVQPQDRRAQSRQDRRAQSRQDRRCRHTRQRAESVCVCDYYLEWVGRTNLGSL